MTDAASAQPAKKRGPLRRLYAWTMRHAQGRYAWLSLGAVSFAESSFFPIPPDVMLVPMALADRKRALLLAAWCTLTSVLGGMVGYAIGAFLYDSVGHWVVSVYGGGEALEEFRAAFAANAVWIILGKGLTPIPFKLVTIAAGFAQYDFGMFVMLSIVTRAGRFFLVAGLIYIFGDRIRDFLEKWLEWAMLAVMVAVIAGFVIARYAF